VNQPIQDNPYSTVTGHLVRPIEHHLQDTEADLEAVETKNASFDTCSRINALLKYSKVAMYINVGGVYVQVIELRPIPGGWIECMIADVTSQNLHLLVKWYTQFSFYLRKAK